MPGSEYSVIPYEVDEITSFLETWLNDNMPGLLEDVLPPSLFDPLVKKWDYIISDDLLKSSDAEVTHNTDVYTKKKEITFNPSPSISVNTSLLRIKWKFKRSGDVGVVRSRIYINGGAVSDIFSTESTDWVQKSYDLEASISYGDKIQLYLDCGLAGRIVHAKDFRIYGKIDPILYSEPTW